MCATMGLPGWGDTLSGELLENSNDSVPTGAKGYRLEHIISRNAPRVDKVGTETGEAKDRRSTGAENARPQIGS